MAEKTIFLSAFPYTDANGRDRVAMRGETVDIPEPDDIERGERLGAFTFEPEELSVVPAAEMPEPTVEEPSMAEKPSGRDSRERWAAYAATKGATEAELAPVDEDGLTREQLREKYGAA
ncbi:hypothetical protein [Winogradskya humida]|uniref:Uncharacterized protein n=1 Tax=Winogradskya humida TaxID=113566 RepID=A0ABQ4A751_9ACTN|nr:hypothetical protein [Actinoplanes humidus]GIE26689.1 hypothetical protein Ahu01nite_097910 [Actinoplanes humidus]